DEAESGARQRPVDPCQERGGPIRQLRFPASDGAAVRSSRHLPEVATDPIEWTYEDHLEAGVGEKGAQALFCEAATMTHGAIEVREQFRPGGHMYEEGTAGTQRPRQ